MLHLCRLCATCTEQSKLITEISEVRSKLTACCGWKPSEREDKMPKKVCDSCVDKLQMSWNFVECIWAAEKQLNKLLNERIQTKSEEESSFSVAIKSEDFELSAVVCDLGKQESDEDDEKDFDSGEIFGEPIHYSNDESVKSDHEQKNGTPERVKIRTRPVDPFIAALTPDERLENGLIAPNAIQRLEELFPNMKTVSWNDLDYKCDECDRTFKGRHNFFTHIRSIHFKEIAQIKVPCLYCNAKIKRDFTLNRHIATKHFVHLKYRCRYCTDYYWDIRELSAHRNLHSVTYGCEACGHTFLSKESFYVHCLSHVPKKKVDPFDRLICDICGKNFKTKGSIRNHMNLHSGKFDHICHQCGWKFQSKGNLKGHLASTHATEKPFKYDHCNKRFKTKHQMKNHSIMHDESFKPHGCSVCGAKFRRKNTLTVHLRSHTKDSPYTCKFCGKSFRHLITLHTHERSHTNDKPYKCIVTPCEYRCTSKGNLNKHMMRAHSIDFRNHIYNHRNEPDAEPVFK